MSPVDDAAAQRELTTTLERFRADARIALGLRATDDATAARRVFMGLCKIYHPAKFARFAPATVRLSNEVFLAIRRAYESVAAASPAPPRAVGSAPPPNGRAATASNPPAARLPTAPAAAERPTGTLPRGLRSTPPAGVPVIPRPPASRPATPRPATPTIGRAAPPAPTPVAAPAAPPSPARAPTSFDQALELARAERWSEARTAFATLATQNPGDLRYRGYLHYARGWEAFGLGKIGEARAEWQRSLACDPGNGLAKWALESTAAAR